MGFCEEIQRSANDGSFTYCHRLVESEQQNSQAAEQAIRQLVREFPGQRIGLFCANDFFAQRVYCACRDMELQVPEQIGIIGFDDLGAGAARRVPSDDRCAGFLSDRQECRGNHHLPAGDAPAKAGDRQSQRFSAAR